MQTLILKKTLRFATLWRGLVCGLLLAVPLGLRAERLPVRTYTSADGLGSSFVSSVMRDSRGFLWFCTRDGLSRFDGSRFVTYQVGGKNGPPGIEQIIETRKGVYWIATTGGLYRFDPNTNLVVPQPTGGGRATLNAEMVSASRGVLYEDRAGNLWIGAGGLYRLEERDGKVIWQKIDLNLHEHWTGGFVISALCEGKDGSLWVVTNRGLLRRLPDGREIFYSVEPDRVGVLTSVLEDHGSRIWLTSRTGIYIIKPESIAEMTQLGALTIRKLDDVTRVQTRSRQEMRWPKKSGEICKYTGIEGLDNGSTRYLYETADEHIWILGGIGPIEFDGQLFNPYAAAQGLAAGLVQAVEDLSGNLWLGGATGLARLNRKGLTTYDAADGLRDSPITIISEGRDGKLTATSDGFFISQFDGLGFHTIRPQLPVNAVSSWTSNYAFLDSRNEWWFLTTEGLHRFAAAPNINALAQARPLAIYTSRDGLKSSLPFHIFEDSKGDLWISTIGDSEQAGLSRWNRVKDKFYTFSRAEEFPTGRAATAFAEDRGGNLWFGFYEGGLVRYRDGRFTEFTTQDGLPDGLITALHLDQSGRLWVASSLGGLSRIDDLAATRPSFVTHTIDNGLASNNIRSLTEDLFGNIYAGTARGIDRLSADGLHIKHYSVNDGLAGDFVYAGFRDRNGVLWFGTSGGLSRLVPHQDKQMSAPSVWLAGLRIAGESRPVPELGSRQMSFLDLTHRQNSLQIDFFAIDFKEGENLRYQYMLEGADKDWGAPTPQRMVNYANLAPGAYRFLVRAVNADGVASAQPATISFRILSPIWQRWWFVALCALIVGGLFFALYRYRMARLREINAALIEAKLAEENLRKAKEERLVELERVRKRIATDLHDDIGSSLTRISLLSEVAQRQRSNAQTSGEGSLSVIAGLSREAVDSMSDIVWAINPEKDSFGDLTQRMRRFAGDVFSARGIEFRFRLPDSDRDVRVGANIRRELFLIFKEAVNNSVRHSECTEAEIEFRVDRDGLFLKLSDNGRGFDMKDKSSGHGLASMRERTEGLGGKLKIVSQEGQGTTLSFVVPLGSQGTAAAGRAKQGNGPTA